MTEGMCDNTPIAEYPSPEGRHRVIVFERSCGATTGFSPQASLLDADEELDLGSGNLFISDPATIRLERGDRSVTLWQVGAANAGHYEGRNVSLVHRDKAAEVSWLDTGRGKTDELQCTAR